MGNYANIVNQNKNVLSDFADFACLILGHLWLVGGVHAALTVAAKQCASDIKFGCICDT